MISENIILRKFMKKKNMEEVKNEQIENWRKVLK